MSDINCIKMGNLELFSIAQNLANSKLPKKLLEEKEQKGKDPREPIKPGKSLSSNLIYTNMIQNKERSRSVNKMVALLFKSNKQKEISHPQNEATNYNLAKTNQNTPSSYNNEEETITEASSNLTEKQMNLLNKLRISSSSTTNKKNCNSEQKEATSTISKNYNTNNNKINENTGNLNSRLITNPFSLKQSTFKQNKNAAYNRINDINVMADKIINNNFNDNYEVNNFIMDRNESSTFDPRTRLNNVNLNSNIVSPENIYNTNTHVIKRNNNNSNSKNNQVLKRNFKPENYYSVNNKYNYTSSTYNSNNPTIHDDTQTINPKLILKNKVMEKFGTPLKTENFNIYDGDEFKPCYVDKGDSKTINVTSFRKTTINNNIINNNNIAYIHYKTEMFNNNQSTVPNSTQNATSSNFNNFNNINIYNLNENDFNLQMIQIEDLIVLEEKISFLLKHFDLGKSIPKFCIEWWTFYTYCSFCGKFEMLFNDNLSFKEIAHESEILEFIVIILIYECVRDPKIPISIFNSLKTLINEIYQNLLIIVSYVLGLKISHTPIPNNLINQIQKIILSKCEKNIYKNDYFVLLKKNNIYISNLLKNIILNYPKRTKIKIDFSTLNFYLKKIQKTQIKTLNEYFKKTINQFYSNNGDSLTFVLKRNPLISSMPVPFLNPKIKKNKYFTLVLDLDETLISYKYDEKNNSSALRIRPGLKEFLTELKNYYELVIFTAGTQEYANPIIDVIENKFGEVFDYRLFRQHANIIDDVFVKDISKLGRNLSKVIIIDNMPNNFRMQKENGIFIKTYYIDTVNDTALLDLIPILRNIAGNINNDVRVELKKYETEIFTRITTNLINELY